ncbi:MAG: hypothetical protein ACKVG4_06275, partial [Longimicrobiales bacterium]
MSDTTESARPGRTESPKISEVCDRLSQILDDSGPAVGFAETLLSKAPPELLSERDPDSLARMALGALSFMEASIGDRVDVSVTNPSQAVEGWEAPVTVLRTNVSERPFIVDTIREYLHAEGLSISSIVYPQFDVERDADKRFVSAKKPGLEGSRESLVHCEVTRVTDPERLEAIREGVASRLQDVVRATDDFAPMIDSVN